MSVLLSGSRPYRGEERDNDGIVEIDESSAQGRQGPGERGVRLGAPRGSCDGMEFDLVGQSRWASRTLGHARGSVDGPHWAVHLKSDRGSAAVEFALLLPVVVMLIVAVFEVGVLVQTQLMLTNAAREGARAAAVVVEATDAVSAARESLPGELSDSVRVSVERQSHVGGRAKVTVEYLVVMFERLGGGVEIPLRSSAEMRVER